MSVLTDIRSSRDLLTNLTLRDIKGKYKRTALGQLWSLVNPIAIMATYSIVFSFVLRAKPAPGNPSGLDVFALWLSCALLPWMFMSNVLMGGMGTIVGNANLIQKVYFPRDTLVISNTLATMFTFSIEMCVLIAATLIFGGAPLLYLPATIYFMIMLAVFSTGIAFALAIANVYFRDTQHFMAIFLQLWFYATPIVYPVSLVASSHPGLLRLYRMNPMARFSEAFRDTIYDGRWPTFFNTVLITVLSFAALGVGWYIFRRNATRLAEEL